MRLDVCSKHLVPGSPCVSHHEALSVNHNICHLRQARGFMVLIVPEAERYAGISKRGRVGIALEGKSCKDRESVKGTQRVLEA